VRDLQIH